MGQHDIGKPSPARVSLPRGLAGIALIGFLAVAEVIPVSSTLGDCPRFFTAHLVLHELPRGTADASSLWLAPIAACLLVLALLPGLSRGMRPAPAVILLAGLSFFSAAAAIPNAENVGPLWLLLGLVWLGANLLVRDVDYFYGTVVGAFLWDLGAGVQGLAYGVHGLPEPYGNGVSPVFVTAVDCVLIVAASVLWRIRLDPESLLARLPGPVGEAFRRSRSASMRPLAREPQGLPRSRD
jgi:hypothetical protein